jgi:hypothetical protein
MSTFFPSFALGSQALDSSTNISSQTNTSTQAKQTADQQMEQLSASGYSTSEIASEMGVPVAEVDVVLDVTQEAAAEQAVAASRHISVKA